MGELLRVAVTGHRGTGRTLLAGALTHCFGVDARRADGAAARAADLVVHLLGAQVRRCDEEFLSGLTGPVVVVAGKADLRAGTQEAQQLASTASNRLGRPVYPVSARRALTEDLSAAGLLGPADAIRACHAEIAQRRAARSRQAIAVQAAGGHDRDRGEAELRAQR